VKTIVDTLFLCDHVNNLVRIESVCTFKVGFRSWIISISWIKQSNLLSIRARLLTWSQRNKMSTIVLFKPWWNSHFAFIMMVEPLKCQTTVVLIFLLKFFSQPLIIQHWRESFNNIEVSHVFSDSLPKSS